MFIEVLIQQKNKSMNTNSMKKLNKKYLFKEGFRVPQKVKQKLLNLCYKDSVQINYLYYLSFVIYKVTRRLNILN